MDIFLDIYKYGIYYHPANRHYNAEVEVGCDKCMRTNISSCVGYKDYDLCLDCMADIDEMYDNGEFDD